MLNVLWPVFLIISFCYGFITGKIDEVNKSIFDSIASAVELSITFLGTVCLWNGIMKIVQDTTLINKLTLFLRPLIRLLFPDLKNNKKAYQEISMNIIANILGLGNAATPLGIKAMKTMQKENNNKDSLSNSMIMFIVLNTASMQIIPTTVIAIRSSMNAENPSDIIVPVWIATICSATVGILVTKLFLKYSERKY